MTTTPDGISFAALQEMLADAPQEEEVQAAASDDDPGKLTPERVREIADKALNYAVELGATGPMVHKMMIVIALHNFIEWHNVMGAQALEEGEIKSAAAWYRDAGKFQAIANILFKVDCGCGDEDFLTDD